MNKTKLVSVRIDEELLRKVDLMAGDDRFYNRSVYIQAGLKLMVELNKRGMSYQALRFHPGYGDKVDELTFKYHREVKR